MYIIAVLRHFGEHTVYISLAWANYFQEILKTSQAAFCYEFLGLYDSPISLVIAIIFVDVGLWRFFVNWIWVKCYVVIFFRVIYAVVNVIVVIFERYGYRIFKFLSTFLNLFNEFDVSVDLVF
mgnify:CR=1 FL=1